MKLTDHLQNLPARKIMKLAREHSIYYQTNFSRSWLKDQIRAKLTEQNYLTKLITKKLTSSEEKLLQKLIRTHSINKDSVPITDYQRLLNYSLIYERNNFCYLFSELKPLLQDIFNLSTTEKKTAQTKEKTTAQTKKFKASVKLENTKQNKLSFFHYLILTLAHINQLSIPQTRDVVRENGLLFLKKINLSSIKSKKLYEQLLKYSFKHHLISKELTLNDRFKKWLQIPYQKKTLSALHTFLPNSASGLRDILAVLSYYPLGEKIPLDFAHQELQIERIDSDKEKTLALLNIFTIKNNQISLQNEAWRYFNPKCKIDFKKIKTEEKNIRVALPIELNKLWRIASQYKLKAIKEEIIFTKKPNH